MPLKNIIKNHLDIPTSYFNGSDFIYFNPKHAYRYAVWSSLFLLYHSLKNKYASGLFGKCVIASSN